MNIMEWNVSKKFIEVGLDTFRLKSYIRCMLKFVSVSIASLLVGCSLPKSQPSRHVAFSISNHYIYGANSVEIMADTLSPKDLEYLHQKFVVSTNYYMSGGVKVEFLEIKW